MLRYFNAWLLYPLAERYQGRRIRAKASRLRRQMRMSFAERRAGPNRNWPTQLERAGDEVPYYRDLFQPDSLRPGQACARHGLSRRTCRT